MVRVQLVHRHRVAQRADVRRSVPYSLTPPPILLVLARLSPDAWWGSKRLLLAGLDLKVAPVGGRQVDLTVILQSLLGVGQRGRFCDHAPVSVDGW